MLTIPKEMTKGIFKERNRACYNLNEITIAVTINIVNLLMAV